MPDTQPFAGITYETLVVEVRETSSTHAIERGLNTLGADGWEPVAAIPGERLVLKRRVLRP